MCLQSAFSPLECVPSIGCMNIKITLEYVKVSVDVKVKVK
jgi:hypothetical protein